MYGWEKGTWRCAGTLFIFSVSTCCAVAERISENASFSADTQQKQTNQPKVGIFFGANNPLSDNEAACSDDKALLPWKLY